MYMQLSYKYSFCIHEVLKFCNIANYNLAIFVHIWNFWHVFYICHFLFFKDERNFIISIMHPNWQVKMHDCFILPRLIINHLKCKLVLIIKISRNLHIADKITCFTLSDSVQLIILIACWMCSILLLNNVASSCTCKRYFHFWIRIPTCTFLQAITSHSSPESALYSFLITWLFFKLLPNVIYCFI